MNERELQEAYYARTAAQYDEMHVNERDEHFFALSLMVGVMDFLGATSILDLGSGTGRALSFIKANRPGVSVTGVEPVEEMRRVGHARGLGLQELVAGDAEALQFPERSFDIVCSFGVLHHVRHPDRAVAEMLRVARKAVFISDSNNFGQGSATARAIKQMLNLLGLWPAADYLKTGGKRYAWSESDGVSYSYSVFNNYDQIRAACKAVHVMNTSADGGGSAYGSASHVALIGLI